ncbi:DUF1212-domain-containing protein [Xylariaceae sp. FL1272]|nr:DUF1212-domain-containing protein [Xylariaceae sp. FL1272]
MDTDPPTPTEDISRTPVRTSAELSPPHLTTTSPNPTTPELGTATKREKGRVRFNSTAGFSSSPFGTGNANLPSEPASQDANTDPKPKPRPSLLRGSSYNSVTDLPDENDEDPRSEKTLSAHAALARAQHVAARVLGANTSGSRRSSIDSDADTIHSGADLMPASQDIPLHELNIRLAGAGLESSKENQEAFKLVRTHTLRHGQALDLGPMPAVAHSGQVTPLDECDAEHYIPPPSQYRGGILSNLLKLYKEPPRSYPHSESTTPTTSGTTTPTRKHKWYDKNDKNRSQETLATLAGASIRLAQSTSTTTLVDSAPNSANMTSPTEGSREGSRPTRPKHKRSHSAKLMNFGRARREEEIRITMHIAETLSRQKYIIKMCKALMLYGAPTHRLEEYLTMSARVLEIDGQFLYLPGCMIISFDDKTTHTTEVKIVRTNQGIDLKKLKDVHEIYKSVLHDCYSVDDAIEQLNTITNAADSYPAWIRVLAFGLASASVAPFAFGGRFIDLGISALLGVMVGALQIFVAPRSPLYNNIFEISATVLTSFLSRALGSLRGGELFCFSALAQSSIALILPGWFVLSAALELQSRALVPGSIRLVYAIIYSLFLGFGITVGITLYGLIDPYATSDTECINPMLDTDSSSTTKYIAFVFVPIFTVCLAIVNQAHWKQMPVMIFISFAGYIVNFWSSPVFEACPQIANTLGAFTVGILANLYSRIRHGVAVTALLPAIFVQVPSGLAASGSLLSGLNAANAITHSNSTVNGTATYDTTSATTSVSTSDDNNGVVYNVAGSMIQIAIGITLGLFLSSLLVYPFGKRRSGLWTL